jgi:hypothetical protein
MKFETLRTILVNIVVTFVQAGVAVWTLSNFALDKATIGGVIGAGLSAVWNTVLKPVLKKMGYLKTEVSDATI